MRFVVAFILAAAVLAACDHAYAPADPPADAGVDAPDTSTPITDAAGTSDVIEAVEAGEASDGGDDAGSGDAGSKIVFGTSETFQGDFAGIGPNGARTACAEAGKTMGLSQARIDALRPWLGLSRTQPPWSTTATYVRVDGVVVCQGTAGLAQPLVNPIALDETGAVILGRVWTGTDPALLTQATCDGWTDHTGGALGLVGDPMSTTGWADESLDSTCDAHNHVYCFEQ